MKFQETFPVPTEWFQDIDLSLADTVYRWAQQEVMAKRLEFHEGFDALLLPAMKKLFVEIGLQNLVWPEQSGGCGLDTPQTAITLAVICEQCARGDVGIAFLLANTFAIQFAMGIGPNKNESLLEEFKDIFCNTEKPALTSLVMPGLGGEKSNGEPLFNGLNFQVRAKTSGNKIVINGTATRPQASGATANLFAVFCNIDKKNPALVLVPGNAKGLSRGKAFLKTGLAASQNADVDFKDVKVPESYCLCTGEKELMGFLNYYYLGCGASALGAGLATWEILKEWGESRVIKGKGQIFKDNPLTASLMGAIGQKIATSRILLYNLARYLSKPKTYGLSGSDSLTATTHAIVPGVLRQITESMNNAMELMGSAGYATEWNLERYWRDVKTMESYVGPQIVSTQITAGHYFGSQTFQKG